LKKRGKLFDPILTPIDAENEVEFACRMIHFCTA